MLKPMRPIELLGLFVVPTALNTVACRVAIPELHARGFVPIEVTYFLCVGLLVLAPMLVWAVHMSAKEALGTRTRDVLSRMRVQPIRGREWAWTLGTFLVLSTASYLIADHLLPRLGLDAIPFFFRNMPLGPGH